MKKTNKILSLVLAVVMLLSTMGVSAFAASTSKTGLYKVNNKWCYMKSGKVDYSVTGLFKHTNGKWYYVKKGVVQSNYTGLVKHTNGKWYHVKNGVKTTYTGFFKHTNGKWYYVKTGVVNSDFTGLAKHTNGKWYYAKKGVVQSDFTGLVKHTNGKWYHIKNGVKTTYTGLAKQTNGKWYYVNSGVVDFSYSGFATHNNKLYFVVNGVVVNSSNTGNSGPAISPDGGVSDAPASPDAGDSTTTPDADLAATADVVKAINDATANAVNASYDWTRDARYTKSMNMGGMTDVLNNIIQGVDENANINSVMGGFLGIGSKSGVVNNGVSDGSIEGKYLLKATTLTTTDIKQFRVNGNTYIVQLNDCTNPDANSSLAHATNDYITCAEVNSSITAAVGDGMMSINEDQSQLAYKNIILTAVINNGQLTSLEYSYTFDVNLSLKVSIMTTTGTGASETKATYSNFKY